MQEWLDKITLTLNLLLGSPANQIEFWVLLGSSFLFGIVVLHKVADAVGAVHPDMGRAIFSFFLGIALILVGLTASGKFVVPRLSPEIARWAVPGTAVVLSLVIIVPLLCLIHRMNYLSSIIVWVVCLTTMSIIIALGGAGFDMAKGLKKDAGAVKTRAQATQEYLDLLGGGR